MNDITQTLKTEAKRKAQARLGSEDTVNELIEKTLKELSAPEKPLQGSRVWSDPKGYQYLGVWQNAALLRTLIRKFTLTLPLKEFRLKAQLDDAARSQKRNIEEGWKRATTSEYLQFLSYAQGSLEEVRGDVRDAREDGFLKSVRGSDLLRVGIDLRVIKGPQASWGEPSDSTHPYSKPLASLKGEDLTYEMFIELINKTDFLLRKLVESLEKKLASENKHYQVEQLRINKRTT
jgi:four helix bundle protein